MDLLRLAGAPGVGKSTTAWSVARKLAADGVAAGYIDTDQLGMCYPAPDDDSDRWALKERALEAIAAQFRLAGVDRLIVSGVAWPDDPPSQIQGISVHSLWLDATEQTRRARLAMRGASDQQVEQFLSAGTAEAARVNPAWARIDTDDLSADATVAKVLEGWHPSAKRKASNGLGAQLGRAASSTDRVLWITGPRLAGASRIGWQIVSQEWSRGARAGFMDLAQLSFAWNIMDSAAVGMANLARLHREFRDVDTHQFVVVAPFEVEPEVVRAALPASDVSFVRLAPSTGALRAHAERRRHGDGPALAGDDAVGATDAAIEEILRTATVQSSQPSREHELTLETRDLSIFDVAASVKRAAGWQ